MTYELFYSDGGHSGPWLDYDTAKFAAVEICRGMTRPVSIKIRERTKDGIGGYGKVVGVVGRIPRTRTILHTRPGYSDAAFGEEGG